MLAKTPPMGWNSWNTFGPNINEQLILETCDAMVEKGYRDAGYEYIVIDDCWCLRERNADGYIVPDPEKFPHGMKYVADYIHSKGMKFGMYSAAGIMTCAGYPGSYGHEYQDAQMFADWGVDYLKYDLCHFPGSADCKNAYMTMSMALKATGRDILFAGCSVGEHEPATWMKSVGAHMYRSTGDITDEFESFRYISETQLKKLCMSGPGCFNDMDMLVVGMHGKGNVAKEEVCSENDYKIHFALWCLFGVPLMIGGDVRNMDEDCHALLTNKELIAINQDPENRPPYWDERQRYASQFRMGMAKFLDNGELILAYFNHAEYPLDVLLYFDDIGVPYSSGYGLELTDILTGENVGVKFDFYNPRLEGRTCRLFKAKFVKR